MLCVIKICMVFFKLISLDEAALFELNYIICRSNPSAAKGVLNKDYG